MRRIVESESLPIEITGLAFIEQRGSVGCYLQRKPTPDEIKAAHPKCGSCRLLMPYKRSDGFYCSNVSDSYDEDGWIEYPEIHYCPHHQPKEQQ